MCWDTAHPLLLRILGNALTRDLYIVYMPLLLLPPVLGLLATPAGCDAAGERVAAAAGFAFHPLLPWAWLAHYVTAQVRRSLPAAAVGMFSKQHAVNPHSSMPRLAPHACRSYCSGMC